jgi:5S rRNA maturation endonuclease (ribonuclease M5)
VNPAELVALLEQRDLHPKATGVGKWESCCPAHADRVPSLSIGSGADDRVLLHCQAGCELTDVLASLDLTAGDLFAADGNGRPAVEYVYTDAAGEVVMKVARRPGKRFAQARPDGSGGWVWNLQGVERVLYRLPRVLAGVALEQTVYIAEGEKDVAALERAGVIATTNPGGAGKWRPAYSKALAGGDIIIIADRDEAGRRHAEDVARSLVKQKCAVRIVEAAEGKDAHDHLAAGLGVEDFKEAKEEAPESSDLAATLDATEAFYRRYVALTEAQYVAVTLWTAHAHALEATATTPYLHVTSPEAECGKSRLLECMEPLTPRPMYAANLTPAVMFRAVRKLSPTLLVDEADNLMKDREAKSELLGLLNAGYRRGAFAYRMGGGNRDELQTFETFCAKVIAGLDDLVATLASRCLRIEMQRRSTDESIEDFFREDAHAEAEPIRDALAAWSGQATDQLRIARPDRLGVRDRLEEALRLLLAIAELAGERWDTRARDALMELAGVSGDGTMSERTQLLTDVRQVFADHDMPAELTSAQLLAGLIDLAESPWRGWWGVEHRQDDEVQVVPSKGAARKLSQKLRPFGIKSRQIGPEAQRRKGYVLADFETVWRRYLAAPAAISAHSAHSASVSQKLASTIRSDDPRLSGHPGPENGFVEPDERNERIDAEGYGQEAGPLVEAALELFGGEE